MMARNMQRPILEAWRLNLKSTVIVAEVNPIQNLALFTLNMRQKIFQRFELPKLFNKLLSKWYYDATLNIHKFRVNIQG